ncbi:MAG: transposase [bacterium]
MIKIVSPTEPLVKFLMVMNLKLSKPQSEHLRRTMEGLIACESSKTLSMISRLFWEAPDPCNLADFFRLSPWQEELLRKNTQQQLLFWAIQYNLQHGKEPEVLVSIDDSIACKPKTSKHFEAVDWHFDATKGKTYAHGTTFITFHIKVGDISFPFNWKLYLREKTVRRINKNRTKKRKIRFHSKMALAKMMLEELSHMLPEGTRVYVLFDSWYASKHLLRFILKKNWHVICALKSNRVFKGKSLSRHARYIRNKSLETIFVGSADSTTKYWIRVKKGRIKGLREENLVIFSKRHPRDKRPAYFLSTDTELSGRQVLEYYTNRWEVEVDHLYLKTRLGLADFRVRSYEATSKYFSAVFLTLCYLYWRIFKEQGHKLKTISDAIALHRKEQWQATLEKFGEKVLKKRAVEPVIQQFLTT